MTTNGISFTRMGALATIALDRPDMGNALDMAMTRSLFEVSMICEDDPSIRCVLLTGAGRLFCAGGDVPAFAAAGDKLPAFLSEITAYLHAAIARLTRMQKPLVTAINGPTAGAGIALALLGDIALADPAAHFTLAYTAIGMSPDGGATWLLPRLIGLRRAQEMCLRNTRVSAAEAAEIGLITRVTDEGKLMAEAVAIANELAAGATPALGATRRLLLDGAAASLDAHLEAESRAITRSGGTASGLEGVAAFAAKRKPDFTTL